MDKFIYLHNYSVNLFIYYYIMPITSCLAKSMINNQLFGSLFFDLQNWGTSSLTVIYSMRSNAVTGRVVAICSAAVAVRLTAMCLFLFFLKGRYIATAKAILFATALAAVLFGEAMLSSNFFRNTIHVTILYLVIQVNPVLLLELLFTNTHWLSI